MPTTYKKYEHKIDENNSAPIQVQSAVEDGQGQNIEDNYLKKDGYSANAGVGHADQATYIESDRQIDNPEVSCPPITFGIAGGEAEIATGINNLEYLEGKSEIFTQLMSGTIGRYSNTNLTVSLINSSTKEYLFSFSGAYDRAWFATNNMPQKLISGHKYLVYCYIKVNTQSSHAYSFYRYQDIPASSNKTPVNGVWTLMSYIFTCSDGGGSTYPYMVMQETNQNSYVSGDTVSIKQWQMFDLTAMGLEGITIDEFLEKYPLGFYEQNLGTILSSKSYQLISRGKNQFSAINTFIRVVGGETYEISGISAGGVLTEYDINKNLIKTSDTFTDTVDIELDEETAYVKIAATTYEDIMFYNTFAEDGGVYGEEYEEPRVQTVELPNIELRSIGDVKDIAYAQGGGVRRIGIVHLGDLTWSYDNKDARKVFHTYNYFDNKYAGNTTHNQMPNIVISGKYIVAKNCNEWLMASQRESGTIFFRAGGNRLCVRDDSFNGDTTAFKNAMNGVYLLYKCVETEIPLSENAGWTENVFVDNYGTLEFTTSPAQVPQVEQPYFIRYTVSLVEFLDTAYVKCEGDGNNVATQKEVDEMKAGNVEVGLARVAENLTPYSENSGAEDTSSFTFQTAGGEADIGSQAELRALRGNTVVWNQLVKTTASTTTSNGITFTNNGDGSWSISGTASADVFYQINTITGVIGHKFLIRGCPKSGSASTYYIGNGYGNNDVGDGLFVTAGAYNNNYSANYVRIYVKSGTEISTPVKFYPQEFDLTQMFGAGNEPTTVAEFNRVFPKPYYEYNAGELISAKSNGYKTVGFNAFDEEWELGRFDQTTGAKVTAIDQIMSKNFIKVIAGQTYTLDIYNSAENFWLAFFDENKNIIAEGLPNGRGSATNIRTFRSGDAVTIPDNCHYIKFYLLSSYGTTYKNDIAIHLTWDNERDGEYEKYNSETYPLPNVELRSAGSVYDELKPDGTLIRRIGVVDLGTLTWQAKGNNANKWCANFSGHKYPESRTGYKPNILCSKYPIVNAVLDSPSQGDKTISYDYYRAICIEDSSLNGKTATQVKEALNGVLLYYELATPTEEQTSNTFQEIMSIDDFGTQEFLYDEDVFPVPQGAEFFYPVDYKAFIDTVYGDTEGDAGQLVKIEDVETSLADVGEKIGFTFTSISRDENGELHVNGLSREKNIIECELTYGSHTFNTSTMKNHTLYKCTTSLNGTGNNRYFLAVIYNGDVFGTTIEVEFTNMAENATYIPTFDNSSPKEFPTLMIAGNATDLPKMSRNTAYPKWIMLDKPVVTSAYGNNKFKFVVKIDGDVFTLGWKYDGNIS